MPKPLTPRGKVLFSLIHKVPDMVALCKNSTYLAFIFFVMALTACDSKIKEDVAAIRAIKEAEQKTQLEREKSDHKAMDDMAKGLARPVTKYPF